MDRDTFKMIHSELIQQVQCTEENLKVIYAAMRNGSFKNNYRRLEKANLGEISKSLKKLDYSDGCPELSVDEYNTINQIRIIRNYWCHQCYLDFMFIENDFERDEQFQRIADKLHHDELRTYDLYKKTIEIRNYICNKYR